MRLDPRALAYTAAAVCGAFVLIVGCANLSDAQFGQPFLSMLQSLFPGYKQQQAFESVLTAAGYAMTYAAITAWIAAWLYNRIDK